MCPCSIHYQIVINYYLQHGTDQLMPTSPIMGTSQSNQPTAVYDQSSDPSMNLSLHLVMAMSPSAYFSPTLVCMLRVPVSKL